MTKQNEAAVLMGFGSTIKLCLVVNIIIAGLFFLQSTLMVLNSRHGLRVVQTIKDGEDEFDGVEAMQRLHQKQIIYQDRWGLRGKVKWFFILSLGILILLGFTTAMQFKVMEQTYEKQLRIFNSYQLSQGSHGNDKAITTDTRSWNYVHVLDEIKKDNDQSYLGDAVKQFTDE